MAVLDTGVAGDHPALAGRITEGWEFDFATRTPRRQKAIVDTQGHGTHVAGLVCGKAVGAAPGAKVISAVMLPRGHGSMVNFLIALEWAAARPEIQIVNVSAGLFTYTPALLEVTTDLMALGLLPVVAVGNEGPDTNRTPGNYPTVISVGASDRNNRVAGFSGGGRMVVGNQTYSVPAVVAPGAGVYSCVQGGGYEAWDGTSMAAPVVSAVAALMVEKYPDITVATLRGDLYAAALDLGLPPDRQGRGLVQVTGALNHATRIHRAAEGRLGTRRKA